MPIYKIRLNPEDVKYGVESRQAKQERLAKGIEWSQLAMDAWKAAVESTAKAILASLPEEMRAAIQAIRKRLPKERPDARCVRCGGEGACPMREEWVPLQTRGKVCFKCMGSGVETSMEPVFFRRRAADTLKEAAPDRAKKWAERVVGDLTNPYRPVLLDLAQAVLEGADFTELPH